MPHSSAQRGRLGLAGRIGRLLWEISPRIVALLILSTIVIGVTPAAVAWATKLFIDEVASVERDFGVLVANAILVGAFSTMAALLGPASAYLNEEARRQLGLNIELRIADKMNSLRGIRAYENPKFYDTIQVAHQAGSLAAPQLLATSAQALQSLALTIGFVVATAASSPGLLLIVSVGAVPAAFIEPWLARRRVEMTLDISPVERRRMFFYRLMLMPSAAREVRVFGLGDYFRDRMSTEYQSINTLGRRQSRREWLWQSVSQIIGGAAMAAALVLVVWSAQAGDIGPGDIALVLASITGIQLGLSSLLGGFARLDEVLRLFSEYEKLFEFKDELKDVDRTLDAIPNLQTGITFDNVWFRYAPDMPWVLRGLSVHIPAGSATGIVGLNGAGKSTFIKLLLRLYDPNYGKILWDGIDIRRFDVSHLRQQYATVLQDYMEYDLTAHENIALGAVEQIGNQEAVARSARFAEIDDRIVSLPAGYDTLLSRMFEGRDSIPELSGGEWQRLSIARGAMRLPAQVTIMDEPTAFLDPSAEGALFRNLEQAIEGRTALLVSHRFTSLKTADQLVVLQDGVVLERGTHEELMRAQGQYAVLYQTQFNRMLRVSGPRENLQAHEGVGGSIRPTDLDESGRSGL